MKQNQSESIPHSLTLELEDFDDWEFVESEPDRDTFRAVTGDDEPVVIVIHRDGLDPDAVRAASVDLEPLLSDSESIDSLDRILEVEGACVTVEAEVAGERLSELIPPGPIFWEDAVWLVRTVGQTLSTAHAHGLVHGELAPSKVRLTETRRPVISGFEVALGRRRSGGLEAGEDTTAESVDVAALALILHAMLCGDETAGLPGSAEPHRIYAEIPDHVRRGIERAVGGGAMRLGSVSLFLHAIEPSPTIRVLPPGGNPSAASPALDWEDLTVDLAAAPTQRRIAPSGLGVFGRPEPTSAVPIAPQAATVIPSEPNSVRLAFANYRGWTVATAAVLLITGVAFIGSLLTPDNESADAVSAPTVLGVTTIAPPASSSSTSTAPPTQSSAPSTTPTTTPQTAAPAEPIGVDSGDAAPTTRRPTTTRPATTSAPTVPRTPVAPAPAPTTTPTTPPTTPPTPAPTTTVPPTTVPTTTAPSSSTSTTSQSPTTTTQPTTTQPTTTETTTTAPPEPVAEFAVGAIGTTTTFESATLSFVTTECATVSFQISGGGSLDLSGNGCRRNHSVRLGGVPYNGTQLRPNTAYSVTVTARSESGQTARRVVQLTTKAQPEAPLRISGLSVTEITATTARVSFTANKCVGSSFVVTSGGSGRYDWGYPVSNHCLTDQWATVGYFQSSRLAPGTNTVVVTAHTATGERVSQSITFTVPAP